MAGPYGNPATGSLESYATGNSVTGSGLQINAPIGELRQYINATESKEAQWLRQLFVTDPRHDKQHLEEAKGGIVLAACDWIVRPPTFQTWRDDTDARLLWINGGPGTGKTMLFCYIVDHLAKKLGNEDRLAYFFCGAGSPEASTASVVLRALAYMLITRSKTPDRKLLEFVGEECDTTGDKALEGPGSWYRLEKIFRRILEDASQPEKGGTIYLCVDALNDCTENLHSLLKFIVGAANSKDMCRVKWLLTSHRASDISRALNVGATATRHGMDLDDYPQERFRAWNAYVDFWAKTLADMQRLNVEAVRKRLRGKDRNVYSFQYTSLLVAKAQRATSPNDLVEILDKAERDVTGLYKQAAERIRHLDDKIQRGCLDALTAVATAYRPLHSSELCALSEIHSEVTKESMIRECEPFFVINKKKDAQITSQSARDFLRTQETLLVSSLESRHHQLFSRSLKIMTRVLRHDMCRLGHPGHPTADVTPEQRERLAGVGYACEYWIDHLLASGDRGLSPKNAEAVHKFLREKFLNWVEAKISNTERVVEIATDALSFIEFNAPSIMAYPLQVYASALVFAPTQSKMGELFTHQKPSWVTVGSGMERSRWSPWIRTLTPQARNVVVTKPAAFSPDGTWVTALLRSDNQGQGDPSSEVAVWDLRTGIRLWTFPGATDCVGFPPWSGRLAVIMGGDMRFWDLMQGCWDDNTIKNLSPVCAAFSADGIWLAAVADKPNDEVQIWDWERGDCVLKFGGTGSSSGAIHSIAFSFDGLWIATADSKGMSVWSHESGNCLWRNDTVTTTIAFSPSPKDLVVSAKYGMLTAWDWRTNQEVRKLVVKENPSLTENRNPVAISADGSRFAVAPASTVEVWNAITRRRHQTLGGHEKYVGSLAFSPDGDQLAVGGARGLKICLTGSAEVNNSQEQRDHKGKIKIIKFSDDRRKIVSVSVDVVLVWDAMNGRRISRIEPTVVPEDDNLLDAALSGDGSCLILIHRDLDPTVWDTESGHYSHTIPHPSALACVSSDSTRAALVSFSHTVNIWDLKDGRFDRDDIANSYTEGTGDVGYVVFSPVAHQIAVSGDGEITLWECLGRRQKKRQTMVNSGKATSLCFSSDGQLLLSSCEEEIRLWKVASGHCVQVVKGVNPSIGVVGFDALKTQILTNFGIMAFGKQPSSLELLRNDTATEKKWQRLGFGIDQDKSWVTWGSDRVLWLPPEYRPEGMAVLPTEPSKKLQASLIVLGCHSGRVVFLRFSGQKPPLELVSGKPIHETR
ncbi:hypothetical protein CHGG_02263 [Chaetomium globosum CBS 148.51]|uniref:NACHT domain-containing protein n=1 Tax=Chaetomium globosum (strain ATCC 6205 / CBS 148.51 / DSM 1962 / NBRC 6347 / NRRL 1970) TaxID=306901 RepID=Q2HBZ1_CHAGB|nr:uncharacterized protein CHGG_02263 [Chaetomium globosum CBS 148.51]EAQ90328.1 hypothetical protein CHGG_02263 [Chaetomium globosum CBS 148.51]